MSNFISLNTVVINMDNLQYAIKRLDTKAEYTDFRNGEKTVTKDIVDVELGFIGKDPVKYTFYEEEADIMFEGFRRYAKSLKGVNQVEPQL